MRKDLPKIKKGFSMIELIIVIAVLGVLTAVVLNQSQKMRESSNISRESSNLNMLATAIQSTFNSQGNYTGLNESVIKSTNAFPAAMDGSGDDIDSVWNSGDVSVEAVDYSSGSNAAFSIVYGDVPQTSCVDFVSNNYSTFYFVDVDGTTLHNKEPGQTDVTFNIGTLVTACGGGSGTVEVEFRSR